MTAPKLPSFAPPQGGSRAPWGGPAGPETAPKLTSFAPPKARSFQSGFTLVEVLVALMLMAILAGMAWQGLDGISRARTVSQARVEQTLGLNTVLAQWEQDLQSVFDTHLVPALGFDGAALRLVRRQPEGLQVVVWTLREQRWMRWAGPVLTQPAALQESWLASQQLLGNEAGHLRMQEGLARWQVYFYRGNAWSNAQSSADGAVPSAARSASAPPFAVRTALPTGVRVLLTFEGAGLQGDLTRDILLAPQWP